MAAVLIDLTLIHCLRGPKLQIISSRNVNWSEDNWLHIKVGKHLPFHQVKIYSFLLQCSLVTLAMRANCLKYVRWLSKLFTSLSHHSSFEDKRPWSILDCAQLVSIHLHPHSVISLLHKENLPGIWMDGSCQRPPGLYASHQSAIHLISSKPLVFNPNVTWQRLP